MEPKREDVGVRLDDGLQERVGAYAAREGLTLPKPFRRMRDVGRTMSCFVPRG